VGGNPVNWTDPYGLKTPDNVVPMDQLNGELTPYPRDWWEYIYSAPYLCDASGNCGQIAGGEPFGGPGAIVKACKGVAKGVAAKGSSVLGKYPDYIKLSSELGAKRFSIPTNIWNKMSKAQQWGANRKFLDRMILRGDNIVLSNPVKNINEVSGAFRQELDYLIGKGFKLSNDGLKLIR